MPASRSATMNQGSQSRTVEPSGEVSPHAPLTSSYFIYLQPLLRLASGHDVLHELWCLFCLFDSESLAPCWPAFGSVIASPSYHGLSSVSFDDNDLQRPSCTPPNTYITAVILPLWELCARSHKNVADADRGVKPCEETHAGSRMLMYRFCKVRKGYACVARHWLRWIPVYRRFSNVGNHFTGSPHG